MSVQRARYTAGKLPQTTEPVTDTPEDALAVLGKSCVSATLWKLFVLMLLLILTSRTMVSVLLKSQVQHTQSTAGCQMSLGPKSDPCINAHCTQGSKSRQLVDVTDICIWNRWTYALRSAKPVACQEESMSMYVALCY